MSASNVPKRAVERRLKSLVAEGFEQVIDRVGVESAQRVLVVCGHEHDFGHRQGRCVADERRENTEAVELRHLDIEQDDSNFVVQQLS
jgi:hypothetical protein